MKNWRSALRKEFAKRLAPLGFIDYKGCFYGRGTYVFFEFEWTRRSKASFEFVEVNAGARNPAWFSKERSDKDVLMFAPVSATLTRSGASSGTQTWSAEELLSPAICDAVVGMALQFFSAADTPEGLQEAQDIFGSNNSCDFRISALPLGAFNTEIVPEHLAEVPKCQRLTEGELRIQFAKMFEAELLEYGFTSFPTELYLTYRREHGEMIDFVSLERCNLGVQYQVRYHVFHKLIWKVRPELEGDYIDIVGRHIESAPNQYWFPSDGSVIPSLEAAYKWFELHRTSEDFVTNVRKANGWGVRIISPEFIRLLNESNACNEKLEMPVPIKMFEAEL